MISVNVSAQTKLPHPTEQFGSIQGAVSLQGEASNLNEVVAVVRDLFAAAQAGVDQHLAEQTGAAVQPPSRPVTSPQATGPARQPPRSTSPSRPALRRGIPPISDAQRRLLDRLLDGDPQRADEVCQRAGVATVGALNMKQASDAIDWCRSQAAPA